MLHIHAFADYPLSSTPPCPVICLPVSISKIIFYSLQYLFFSSVFAPIRQPPLFYNWDLDERPFFNRITGLMRSMMMLGGLISFNLNPMSIFSYPIELGLSAGFINPRYGVDDIIAKVRWMCSTNSAVPVLLLPVPVISGKLQINFSFS